MATRLIFTLQGDEQTLVANFGAYLPIQINGTLQNVLGQIAAVTAAEQAANDAAAAATIASGSAQSAASNAAASATQAQNSATSVSTQVSNASNSATAAASSATQAAASAASAATSVTNSSNSASAAANSATTASTGATNSANSAASATASATAAANSASAAAASAASIPSVVSVAKGGTGLTALGTAKQVLRTNAGATALEYASLGVTDIAGLSTVATSGSYNDLANKPTLATVATSGSYADLTGKPSAYALPTASATVLGGIKVGTGLSIDGNGVLSSSSAGTGTVTSVNLTAGSNKLTVSGGPITSSGSIAVDVNQANLDVSQMTGTLGVAHGGTGLTALGTPKQYLRTNSAGTALEFETLTASDVSGLSTVATSGAYSDLSGRPGLATVATSGLYSDLSGRPALATVATSGSYADLSNKPSIPAAQVNADWNASTGIAQILNKPSIPAAQVNSDWNAASGVAQILNKPALATVATSGSYTDLSNKPAAYSLPTASASVLGGIMVGSGLSISAGVLSATGGGSGTVTSVAVTSSTLTVTGSPITSSGTIDIELGTVGVANGGTGANTLTGLLYGNGTSAMTAATGAQIATALGSTNISGSAANVTGTVAVAHGGTGLTALGTANQVLQMNSGATAPAWTSLAYDIGLYIEGVTTASEVVFNLVAARAFTWPSGLTGSFAKAGIAATASTTFTINRNGSSIGSFVFAASGTSATFTLSSPVTFAAGDVIQITAPATADSTLANIAITFAGTR
ncbi:beta strand repeat-containing protein [Paraburkholderia graminis]